VTDNSIQKLFRKVERAVTGWVNRNPRTTFCVGLISLGTSVCAFSAIGHYSNPSSAMNAALGALLW